MKIPCTCKAGFHSFSAHEMVDIIAAFQRGELHTVSGKDGKITALKTRCLAEAEFGLSRIPESKRGKCMAGLPDGSFCFQPRGHREGRHQSETWKGGE